MSASELARELRNHRDRRGGHSPARPDAPIIAELSPPPTLVHPNSEGLRRCRHGGSVAGMELSRSDQLMPTMPAS